MIRSLPPALIDCMHQHQYRPERLKPSGSGFLRFPIGSEANGSTSGYVKLFPDGESAIFGDFKSGMQIIWNGREENSSASTVHLPSQDELKKVREEINEERCRFYALAADKAAELYGSAKDARSDHPYLVKKSINPCGGIRQSGSQLFVPIYIEDKITSLQFIEEDGTKRFLSGGEIKGGYHVLGTPSQVLCIAEGYATGCSIYEATGYAVAAAFNAGNLMHVAQAMRRQYKEANLILCADNDHWTEGNPGLKMATEAAWAVGGLLAVAHFTECDMSGRPTDFNDLHVLAGKDAVKRAITAAKRPGNAHEPALSTPATPDSHSMGRAPSIAPIQRAPHLLPAPDHRLSFKDAVLKDKAAVPVRDDALSLSVKADDKVVLGKTENLGTAKAIRVVQLRELLAPLAPPQMADVGFPPLIREICRSCLPQQRSASGCGGIKRSSLLQRNGRARRIPADRRCCDPLSALFAYCRQERKGSQGNRRSHRRQDFCPRPDDSQSVVWGE